MKEVFFATVIVLLAHGVAQASCSVEHQLRDLSASPAKCSPRQMARLEAHLKSRLDFYNLDVEFAQLAVSLKACPGMDEFNKVNAAYSAIRPRVSKLMLVIKPCHANIYNIYPIYLANQPLNDSQLQTIEEGINERQETMIPAIELKLQIIDGLRSQM